MAELVCCFIKEKYFVEHPDFINLLDEGDLVKQSRRSHICIEIEMGDYKAYVPLRNNLGEPVRKFGRIGFSVPTQNRPSAGLDYRHCLIIGDTNYIEYPSRPKIPKAQRDLMLRYIDEIERQVRVYIGRYIKTARKGRVEKEALFRVSSLVNFDKELGV